MGFRKKLIITYTVFMLAVSVVVGIGYQNYSMRQLKSNEYKNMEILARHMLQNADFTIQSMEDAMSYFLSDMEVLKALNTLSGTKKEDLSRVSYREEARNTVRSKLNTDYLINHFYRVVFFNAAGDCIASNNDGAMLVDAALSARDYPWLQAVKGTRGRPVLINVHEDNWGLKQKPLVFSLVKEIQGPSLGYLEVQKTSHDLEELFRLDQEGLSVVVVQSQAQNRVLEKSNGETAVSNARILYSDQDETCDAFYLGLGDSVIDQVIEVKNPISGKKEVIYGYGSAENGLTVMVIEDKKLLALSVPNLMLAAILVSGCFFLVSILVIIALSNHLTKPLRQLKETMEHTQIQDLQKDIRLEGNHDEIKAVNQAYQNLLKRLNESIIREKRLSLLQLQAQFDLLQTQINPHFLYNVLNILANRGMENEDDMTCEICGSLASMMRYALNTKERYAPIRNELEYLEQYFFLLKCRYEHKLEYEIRIEEDIRSEIIPKIILQQFVENSVSHGYENSDEVKKIIVEGWLGEDRHWYLKVSDNGEGFGQEIISQIKKKMEKIRDQLTKNRDNLEAEIGGLGLVNTYARLYLIYGDELIFEIHDKKKGAEVKIGAPMENLEV